MDGRIHGAGTEFALFQELPSKVFAFPTTDKIQSPDGNIIESSTNKNMVMLETLNITSLI